MIYLKCVDCNKLDERKCDGPNFAARPVSEIVEWMNARLHYLGWTHKTLADKAQMPLGTIDPIMARKSTNPTLETLRPLLHALGCGGGEDRPCPDAATIEQMERELSELRALNNAMPEEAQRKIDYLKKDVERWEKQAAEKDAQIRNVNEMLRKKEKLITVLSVILGIVGVALVLLFAFDFFIPAFGMFRGA